MSKDKQMDHDSSSESELDCSRLIHASNGNDASVLEARFFDKFHTENSATTSYSSDNKMQNLVYKNSRAVD